ncbi:hypothetical protein TRVL_03894 [Trypanosoma vivax]|nr:hypothetical protein TRVL_03894 [Trypanosoma vivax]
MAVAHGEVHSSWVNFALHHTLIATHTDIFHLRCGGRKHKLSASSNAPLPLLHMTKRTTSYQPGRRQHEHPPTPPRSHVSPIGAIAEVYKRIRPWVLVAKLSAT